MGRAAPVTPRRRACALSATPSTSTLRRAEPRPNPDLHDDLGRDHDLGAEQELHTLATYALDHGRERLAVL